jgi:hypothetical protein
LEVVAYVNAAGNLVIRVNKAGVCSDNDDEIAPSAGRRGSETTHCGLIVDKSGEVCVVGHVAFIVVTNIT